MAKTKLLPIALIALLIVGTMVVSGMFEGIFSVISSGMTISSISLAYPPVESQPNEWIVSAKVNGWGQSIVGNLDKTDITYQGVSAEYPLQISGYVSANKGHYLIDNSNPKSIFQYRVTEKHGTVTNYIIYATATPAPPCDGSPAYEIVGKYPTGFLNLGSHVDVTRSCIYKDIKATVAPVSGSPNIYPTVDVTVSVNNQPQTVTLKGSSIYALPNSLGSVAWTNSPVEAHSLGAISFGTTYVGVAPVGSSAWKVAKRNDYEGGGADQSWSDATILLDSKYYALDVGMIDMATINCDGMPTVETASTCIRQSLQNMAGLTNGLAQRLLNSNVNINTWSTSYGVAEGQQGFWVDLGNVYASTPELQFRIKSQWLGIVFPNGIPQVISASGSPKPFRSGDSLTAEIVVKNIGSGTGSFVVQDVSCGSLQKLAQTYPVSIAAGKTDMISFNLGTTGATTESGTCSGKVVDTGSLKSSSWSFQYEMTEPAQCIEGKTYVFGNVIKICVDGVLVDLETCQYGVIMDASGKWICAAENDDINISKACKLDTECDDGLWWTYDTCDRTTWQEILNQEGLCKHTDLKALMIIGVGMFIAVLVAIIMSGRKK